MTATDLAGWGAAGLTLLTFVCRDMRQLRLLAICANGAFITYGTMAGLVPVLVLHMALAPVNVWRLLQHGGRARARHNRAAADRVPSPIGAPTAVRTVKARVPGRAVLRAWRAHRVGPARAAIRRGLGEGRRALRSMGLQADNNPLFTRDRSWIQGCSRV